MVIQLINNNSKAIIKIDSNTQGILNDVKSLINMKKNIKVDKDLMSVNISGKLKLDLVNETLTILF